MPPDVPAVLPPERHAEAAGAVAGLLLRVNGYLRGIAMAEADERFLLFTRLFLQPCASQQRMKPKESVADLNGWLDLVFVLHAHLRHSSKHASGDGTAGN